MGEVYLLDKNQADTLLSLGFQYKIRKMDNKEVFVFIQTQELMQELNSKFERGSFFINKSVYF